MHGITNRLNCTPRPLVTGSTPPVTALSHVPITPGPLLSLIYIFFALFLQPNHILRLPSYVFRDDRELRPAAYPCANSPNISLSPSPPTHAPRKMLPNYLSPFPPPQLEVPPPPRYIYHEHGCRPDYLSRFRLHLSSLSYPHAPPPPTSSSPFRCSPVSFRRRWAKTRPDWLT